MNGMQEAAKELPCRARSETNNMEKRMRMYQGSMARLASLRIIAIEVGIDSSCKRIDLALILRREGCGLQEMRGAMGEGEIHFGTDVYSK